MKRDRKYNDHRAAHYVHVLSFDGRGATNVAIPYRGFIISLAADGADTCVFRDDDNRTEIIGCGVLFGTGGDAVKRAIQMIDLLAE